MKNFITNDTSIQRHITVICVFIGLALSPDTTNAQFPTEPHVRITTEDGLPSDRIMSIAIDPEGFAWLGTDSGLSRFDGNHVETFYHSDEDSTSIADHFIMQVMPDYSTGKIWLATLKGLSVLNPKTKIFKNYKHDSASPNSIPDNRANRILKDKNGVIWIGFKGGGLLRYRPDTDDFERFFCKNDTVKTNAPICSVSVVDIAEDLNDENILWLGTQNGIIKFNKSTGGHEQFIYGQDQENPPNTPNNIRCIFNHRNGKIYYGTWWGGVYFFDTKTKEFSKLNACYKNGSEFFERDVILSFYPKTEHQFWITSTTGLQLYDTQSGCIIQSYVSDEERTYGVNLVDKFGRTWSAPRKGGLSIYDNLRGQSHRDYYQAEDRSRPSYTVKILEDTVRKKTLVLSCFSQGLYIKDQKTGIWDVIPPPDDYPIDKKGGFQVLDMEFLENGAVFITEYNRLYWYKPGFKKLELYPTQLSEGTQDIRYILKDSEDLYWISCGENVFQLDAENQTFRSYKKELNEAWKGSLGGDFMAEDIRGNIWIREINGLLIYKKSENKFIYHPHDSKERRALRNMGPIYADKSGGVWIATNQASIGYAHADSLEMGILKYYGRNEGYTGGNTFSIEPRGDILYISTETGLQLFDYKKRKFLEHYDSRYGFDAGANNFITFRDGTMGIGMWRHINLFHPDSIRTNSEAPLPYVSGFHVFDIPWRTKNSPHESDTISLSYKQNFFSFDISSISYNFPKDVKYEYKLEGLDENWKDGTKRKFAAYTNVPSGDYQFKIRAINNDGVLSEQPSITYLHIAAVWWKTIWFWTLVTIFIMGVGYLIYRSRIAQVRKEERLKAEFERKLTDVEMSALRAQMNPHFIFNSLNSIDYYIISNEQEKASDYLNRFSRLIRLILQNSKSSIVPLKDDLEALKLYIELESLRFDNLFEYEVKMEKELDPEEVVVPPMLLQPYVENAIWHGLMQKEKGKGHLELTLRKNNSHLICQIEDNGIGRDAAQKLKSKSASRRKSYGMKITSDRLAMLNKLASSDASVQIFDLKNEDGTAAGTRVELVIPL